MSGRLISEQKAPEVVQYVMAPFLSGMADYFEVHLKIHKAHVLMLGETGLLAPADGQNLLRALVELEAAGQQGLVADANTDLYMQMERFITERTGALGGRMHTGRSRNDLYATAARMMTRSKLLALLADVSKMQGMLLDKAEAHAATVMPGYTHMQHAEPVTYGHYLLAFHDAIARDMRRLWSAYDETNLNALGAAALAGSSFALDRSRTAALLGFDGIVENSYDAVASRDYIVEAVSALAILCGNVGRVADQFILWVTSEYDMIDLPDSYGYTSSIMPQKRNPGYFIEAVRSRSARVSGHLMGVLATVKGTTFGHSRDMSYEITVPAYAAFEDATAVVNVMRGVIDAADPRREAMLVSCAGQFSGATEIANLLAREAGLPFRSAYGVIATLVRQSLERGLRPLDIRAQHVEAVALELLGHGVGLTDAQVQGAMDPALNVQMKQTVGSPSRRSMDAMLLSRQASAEADGRKLHERQAALLQADALLAAAIAERLGTSG